MPGWNCKKIKQKLNNTLRLNFCYLKFTCFLHLCYHPLKIVQKMKNENKRYDINRVRLRCDTNILKYKMGLSIMTAICIEQHQHNVWSSIHKKVKQNWGWVEKQRCL